MLLKLHGAGLQGAARLQRLAAADLDALPVEPAHVVRQQGRDRCADVVRQPDPAERRRLGEHLIERLVVAHLAVRKIRLDGSGRHDVDPDLPVAELPGHVG